MVRKAAGRVPRGGNSKHKGPEVGNVEACFGHRKEASVAEVLRVSRVEWDVGHRWAGAKSQGTMEMSPVLEE